MTFSFHAACASLVLVVGVWLSSGTLAPYAATIRGPLTIEPCHYLANTDHDHFVAAYRMLDGNPRSTWQWSHMLRRILFPLLAFPMMKIGGFLTGGVVASLVLQLIGVNTFAVFVRRLLGHHPSIAVLWLLATYPGIAYWGALPYAYVAIVPGAMLSFVLLYRLRASTTSGGSLVLGVLLGLIFTGYDLMPFFAPCAIAVLALQRRFRHALLCAAGMLAPALLVSSLFQAANLSVQNANSDVYFAIIEGWLRPGDLPLWGGYLRALPSVLISNFFYSNFVILPVLGLVAGVVARHWIRWDAPESLLLLTGLLLFLFNNAAPPYVGWQLRGSWMARLYQPLFVSFLMYAARATLQFGDRALWKATIALAVLLNGAIVAGPVTLNSTAMVLHHKFYAHSDPGAFLDNLRRYGRRPLGFCEERHLEQGWNPPAHRRRSPTWMVR